MKKNMYGLLNEIEMDFSEYEDFELSPTEKVAYQSRILREVNEMDNRNIRRTKKNGKWKVAVGIAAAFALMAGTVRLANPILADSLFSSVFGNLIDNAKGEKDEAEEIERLTKIGEKSVDVQEEVEKQQDADAYQTTSESNGVSISVSDIYCDGYMLYYTASLKTDDAGLNQADGILGEFKSADASELSVGQELLVDGMDLSGYTNNFQRAEDGTFVSAHQVDLMSGAEEGSYTPGEEKTFVVDWTLHALRGKLWDEWDTQGEYKTTGTVEGEWHLRFPVTVDATNNKTFRVDQGENGITIKDAVRTKAGLALHIDLPDFRQEPYRDPYNDPDMVVKDAQGNSLQWMAQRWEEHDDGTSECWIMVLYDGETDLSLKVTAKDENATLIADIPFQVLE